MGGSEDTLKITELFYGLKRGKKAQEVLKMFKLNFPCNYWLGRERGEGVSEDLGSK